MRVPAAFLLVLWLTTVGVSAAPMVVFDGTPLPHAAPLCCAGALLLPLRPVFGAMQAQTRWLPKERKVEARRGEQLVELWVGTPVAQVNHAPVQLDVPPLLLNGQTYVPLRLVVEAFGGQIQWDASTQTATIVTPK